MRLTHILLLVPICGMAVCGTVWAQSSSGQPTSQAPPQMPAAQTPTNQAPANQAPANQAPANQVAPSPSPETPSGADVEASSSESSRATDAVELLPELPAAPTGKSTLVGGRVSKVDHVRDEIMVQPFGGRNLKIVFDGRTQIFRDGAKATASDLRGGDKIYVDTILDGTTIFAKNIRILTQRTSGESRGQVVSFDSGRAELLVNDPLSPEPVTIRVTSSTKILREQHAVPVTDLRPRSLVSVKFRPGSEGGVVAGEIAILAEPGSDFPFAGRVTNLDLHTGLLVLEDPRDKKTYEVHFDPSTVRIDGDLVEGAEVSVSADFDGTRYTTNSIIINSAPASQ